MEMSSARVLLAGALLFLLLGVAQVGRSEEAFDNSSLFGTYVVALSGHDQRIPPTGPDGNPVVALEGIGLLTFDGKGTITKGKVAVNFNGDGEKDTVIPSPFGQPSTYSVSPDGSCSIKIVQSPFNAFMQFDWDCTIVSKDEVHFIGHLDQSFYALIQGTLTKQHAP
jgi:hypothetical protein